MLAWGAGSFAGTVTLALAIIALMHALTSAAPQASYGDVPVLDRSEAGV
jgi:hypothetical protein